MKITIGKSFHDAAGYHTRCAKLHKTQVDILSDKIAKLSGLEKSAAEAARDFHKSMQSEHEDEAQRCEGCAISIEQGLEDAGGDSDLPDNAHANDDLLSAALGEDKDRFLKHLQPDRVRGVMPESPRITAVPRFCSAPVETPASATLGGVDFLDLKALGED